MRLYGRKHGRIQTLQPDLKTDDFYGMRKNEKAPCGHDGDKGDDLQQVVLLDLGLQTYMKFFYKKHKKRRANLFF